MAKMRIYEIAKSLNMKSADLKQILNENGFEAKSPQSNIEDPAIAFILKKFSNNKAVPPVNQPAESHIREKNQTEVHTEKPLEKKEIRSGEERTLQVKHAQEPNNVTEEKNTETPIVNSKPAGEVKPAAEQMPAEQKMAEDQKKTVEEKPVNRQSNYVRQGENRRYEGQRTQDGSRPANSANSRPSDGSRPYNGNSRPNDGSRPYNNTSRPSDGTRPYNNTSRPNDGSRPYNNTSRPNDGTRPYNNTSRPNDGSRPYNNTSRPNDGTRPYNNTSRPNDGSRPYNNTARPNDGTRPYNNTSRPYNNTARPNDGTRPYNNTASRPNDGSRPYNNTSRPNDGRPSYPRPNDRPYGQRPAGAGQAGGGQRPMQSRGYDDKPSGGNGYGNKNGRSGGAEKSGGMFEKDSQMTLGKNTKVKNKSKNKEKERAKENRRDEMPKKDPNRKGAFIKPKPIAKVQESADTIRNIVLPEIMTIKEFAEKLKLQPSAVVKKLFLQGKMVSINNEVTFEEAEELALEYNCIAEREEKVNVIEELLKEEEEDASTMEKRPPVVCVMGHVDHGKTSLLDAIRETRVTEKEAGGITQHIGAYVVALKNETITFLDTPGHEAFTSMRMRGAKSTDIAILVVAADDGVMPQTIEAISHAKAAGVEIIVAINKIDKPGANVERVKQELVEHELVAEDWGGSTVFVSVSAKTGEGLEHLLEMITLTADMLELKANTDRKARGIVIEAQLDKGRGPVATILVQKGTLHVGDSIAIGSSYGKVRAMMDDKGRRLKEATPSTPVEILGLNEVPNAGEIFMATENDKEARSIAEAYIKQSREKLLDDTKAKLSLDGLFSQIQAGNVKELNLIVKADVQGSVEAVKQSLLKLTNEEVAIRIIHGGVGAVNESDVSLASASNAIIIAFNVRPDNTAKEMAEREKVDLRIYKIIYNAIEDIEAAMKGMLDPVFEEKVIGHAEIRQIFTASGLGTIAGSYVMDGRIVRNSLIRISREGIKIHEGALASLKRFKDDVKEVATGYECGLVFEKFNDFKELDQVEAYIMEEVPR